MRRKVARLLLVPLAAASLAAVAAARPAAPAPVEPAAPATSFSAVVRHAGGTERLDWQAPERFAVRARSGEPALGGTVARDGTVWYRYSPEAAATLLARTFAARPDAYPEVDQLRGPSDFVLAQARAGRLRLQPAGAAAWRARVFAPANKCAGFGSGSIELVLRRADLLPLRLLERHGGVVARNLSVTYLSVNRALPAARFAPPRADARTYRDDQGFVRTSAAAAARRLSYAPRLPTHLPRGFRLAVSGWAPRSAATGPEGSIPPARELFAAVYRRGIEHVDVTQRLAPAGGWANDPFGAECVRMFTERATIGGAAAVYGAGPSTTPHLYWRSGRLLYTVSGPFPKAELAAIARSLRPVG